MKRYLPIFCIVLLAPLFGIVVLACSDFERNTFKTLSASKAILDTSQTDYETGVIPHNACAYALINNGKAAQTVAVNAMLAYEGVKAAKGDLAATTAIVTADLIALAPIVVNVQSLIANPATCLGAK